MIDIKQLVRANILELKSYTSARDEFFGEEGVFLDANENPFGILNRYPDPYQRKLKEQLARLKDVQPQNIFIGNGSDEVIDLALRIFCNPGVDKALIFTPTYGMYAVSAAVNAIEVLEVPLTQEFQIDVKKVEEVLADSSIKLIFICSPNNPTGNVLRRSDIETILERFKGIVLIDEAYIDFSQEISLISALDRYKNLIVSQTFSKAWGLAGARLGTAYANEEIIALFNKIKPPYNVSTLNQQAAIDVLNEQSVFEENLRVIQSEKQRLIDELQGIETVLKIYPSDANFLLVEMNDAERTYNALVERQIITRNRSTQVANCIRITIGAPTENNELINALKELV